MKGDRGRSESMFFDFDCGGGPSPLPNLKNYKRKSESM